MNIFHYLNKKVGWFVVVVVVVDFLSSYWLHTELFCVYFNMFLSHQQVSIC